MVRVGISALSRQHGPRGGPAAMGHARRDQQPAERGRAGVEQCLAHVEIQPEVGLLLVGREPVGQAGLEALAAGLERDQPDGFERHQQLTGMKLLGLPTHERAIQHALGPQRADRGFAVVAEKFDQFGKDLGLVCSASPGIPLPPCCEHFLSLQFTPSGCPGCGSPSC